MSTTIDKAVELLNEKTGGRFDGSVKFVIGDEGAIMLDGNGARAGDEDAEVTLTADAETFQDILSGALSPTEAFMSQRLTIDGDLGKAMELGAALG